MTVTIDHLEEIARYLGVEPHEILELGKRNTGHPEWCEEGPDCSEDAKFERVHFSKERTRNVEAPGRFGDSDSGEDIEVRVRWSRYDSHPQDPPPACSKALEIIMQNRAYTDEFQVTGGPDHIRKIAAVLVEEADRMERSA
ncbi:DUF6907 domain-containing protein [Nesterenkonia marinintestina]|uniref:DUF6907 domain-containing protein n=1 Tax=Nesterenkonia marinintestina TaxID=2979865 RepID=UPI0021C000CF|nr:hypothetical protein [Nesterenkonia sp. GX14115]